MHLNALILGVQDIESYLGDDLITQALHMYQFQIQKVTECYDVLNVELLLSNSEKRSLKLSGTEKDEFMQAIIFTIPYGISYCLADLRQVTGCVHVSCGTTPEYTDWCFYWPGSVTISDHSNTSFSGERNYDEDED